MRKVPSISGYVYRSGQFRACKNDIFLFIMGTLSLEARNIRFVNSNLSRVHESKLIPAS
jgi:hypothetical protein